MQCMRKLSSTRNSLLTSRHVDEPQAAWAAVPNERDRTLCPGYFKPKQVRLRPWGLEIQINTARGEENMQSTLNVMETITVKVLAELPSGILEPGIHPSCDETGS